MEARHRPTIRAAVIQHPPVSLNLEYSLERAETLVAEAARGGAEIVAFPETWLPGYPVWLDGAPEAAVWGNEGAKALYQLLTEQSIEIPGAAFERLRALAGAHKVDLVMETSGHYARPDVFRLEVDTRPKSESVTFHWATSPAADAGMPPV